MRSVQNILLIYCIVYLKWHEKKRANQNILSVYHYSIFIICQLGDMYTWEGSSKYTQCIPLQYFNSIPIVRSIQNILYIYCKVYFSEMRNSKAHPIILFVYHYSISIVSPFSEVSKIYRILTAEYNAVRWEKEGQSKYTLCIPL